MANKNLKSIKFPNLPDTYIVPQVDNTLTQPDRPADAKKTGDEISALKEDLSNLGLSVVDGAINITYEEVSA